MKMNEFALGIAVHDKDHPDDVGVVVAISKQYIQVNYPGGNVVAYDKHQVEFLRRKHIRSERKAA